MAEGEAPAAAPTAEEGVPPDPKPQLELPEPEPEPEPQPQPEPEPQAVEKLLNADELAERAGSVLGLLHADDAAHAPADDRLLAQRLGKSYSRDRLAAAVSELFDELLPHFGGLPGESGSCLRPSIRPSRTTSRVSASGVRQIVCEVRPASQQQADEFVVLDAAGGGGYSVRSRLDRAGAAAHMAAILDVGMAVFVGGTSAEAAVEAARESCGGPTPPAEGLRRLALRVVKEEAAT